MILKKRNLDSSFNITYLQSTLLICANSFIYSIQLCYHSVAKGKQTIIPKIEGKTIGQRKMMSKTDCLKINDLYGCLGTPPNYNRKYYMLCNYMGL